MNYCEFTRAPEVLVLPADSAIVSVALCPPRPGVFDPQALGGGWGCRVVPQKWFAKWKSIENHRNNVALMGFIADVC